MMINMPMFGLFERNELKKFMRLGVVFSCIIGTYWALGMLKQAIFCQAVGADKLPYARIISMLGMLLFLAGYTRLLHGIGQRKIFYALSLFYGCGIVFFAALLMHPIFMQFKSVGFCEHLEPNAWGVSVFAYIFAFFCDSYVLVIALFWAIVTDCTLPESAKKGFSLIVAFGQVGGIILPIVITRISGFFGLATHALSVISCLLPIVASTILLYIFLKKTPDDLLVSFKGQDDHTDAPIRPGFLEGIALLKTSRYLAGIFCLNIFPDIVATVFDLHFNLVAAQHYPGIALAEYFGMFGGAVNATTLFFLLLGVNNITRLLGVNITLVLMPAIFTGALIGFLTLNSLTFLFSLMVGIKAINYALSVPAIKQLYIPTSHKVRFEAQAWIDAFHPHTSKLTGSLLNMGLHPLQQVFGREAGRLHHVLLTSGFGFLLVGVWSVIALHVGRIYRRAVDSSSVVGE